MNDWDTDSVDKCTVDDASDGRHYLSALDHQIFDLILFCSIALAY